MPLQNCSGVEKSTSVDSDQEQICLINLTNELLSYNVVESACKFPSERIRRQKSIYFATLEKIMDELLENNPRVFKGMVKRLGIEKLNKKEAGDCLGRVFTEMHTDKHYNWGRIVTVYAFLRSLAQYLDDCNKSDHLEEVASATTLFVSEHLSKWIYQQGGWEKFEKFFMEKASDSPMWKGFLYTFLGLGAIANLRYMNIL